MAFQQLPLFKEPRTPQRQEQIALRYQWCRDALRGAREAFFANDIVQAVHWLVHAVVMRESAREWRDRG